MKVSVLVTALIATGLLAAGEQSIAAGTSAPPSASSAKSGLSAERKALITEVVMKWSSYVQKVRGVKPQDWARSMGATFATADIANFRRAAAMTTYEGMIATLLGQQTTDAKIINSLAKNGSVANLQALASPSSGLVYTVITPCRVLDTRSGVNGRLLADSVQSFEDSRPGGNFVDQGGSTTDCGIPADPAAVVLNVVSVRPDAAGFITLFPYGVAQPLTSTINNVAGEFVANETIVKQTIGDVADFSIYSYVGTHVVADAVGYFSAPASTPSDCVLANSTQSTVLAGATYSISATCPTGYSITGGGARVPGGNANMTMSESFPDFANNTWNISGKNSSAVTDVVQARASCCRVPGM
jgi:hypothetical protein